MGDSTPQDKNQHQKKSGKINNGAYSILISNCHQNVLIKEKIILSWGGRKKNRSNQVLLKRKQIGQFQYIFMIGLVAGGGIRRISALLGRKTDGF
jgi:hypothetical protein